MTYIPAGVAREAVAIAERQVGDPYVWGAEGPNAFDCSGLVYYAFHNAGLKISRTTSDVYGSMVNHVSRAALAPGMIVQPHPGHIQIYVGNGRVCEAPRTGLDVRVVPMWGWWRGGYFPGTMSLAQSPNRYPGHLIRYGDRGGNVAKIKHRLGLGGDVFGHLCLAHVKAFQKAHRLQVDGVVGPKTWGAMF